MCGLSVRVCRIPGTIGSTSRISSCRGCARRAPGLDVDRRPLGDGHESPADSRPNFCDPRNTSEQGPTASNTATTLPRPRRRLARCHHPGTSVDAGPTAAGPSLGAGITHGPRVPSRSLCGAGRTDPVRGIPRRCPVGALVWSRDRWDRRVLREGLSFVHDARAGCHLGRPLRRSMR